MPLELAGAHGDEGHPAELMTFVLPEIHLRGGDLERAWHVAGEGTELAARLGIIASEANGATAMTRIALLRGDFEAAIRCGHRAVEAAKRADAPYLLSSACCTLGSSYLELGPELHSETQRHHAEALRALELPMGTVMGAMAWAEVGHCVLGSGKPGMAQELFQRGLDVPNALMYLQRPRLLTGMASTHLALGQLDQAERFGKEADEYVRGRAMLHYEAELVLCVGRIALARGDLERAAELASTASALARRGGCSPYWCGVGAWRRGSHACEQTRGPGQGRPRAR